MKVIDFRTKGNVIKLYFGDNNDNDYWGDDWDDTPYEHNAGTVYSEYVEDIVEYAFPFSFDVMEAAGDWHYGGNSPFSKEDMKNKKCPCLIIKKIDTDDWYFDNQDFSTLLGSKEDDVLKIYFNDDYEILDSKIKHFGGVYLGKGHMYE